MILGENVILFVCNIFMIKVADIDKNKMSTNNKVFIQFSFQIFSATNIPKNAIAKALSEFLVSISVATKSTFVYHDFCRYIL